MLVGERCLSMPEADPMVRLASGGSHAGLLARLHHDVLADLLTCYMRARMRSRTDCHMLDLVRAEYHRRHAPDEPEPVCSRCLLAFEYHDELEPHRCPDDQPWG